MLIPKFRSLQMDLFERRILFDAVCITTNGTIKKNGAAVMGRGCALEAKTKFNGIDSILGNTIKQKGNQINHLLENIYSFPVKHNWWERADPTLIEQSAIQLKQLADENDWKLVCLPRPGCGNGGLDWRDVKQILEKAQLDARFVIVSKRISKRKRIIVAGSRIVDSYIFVKEHLDRLRIPRTAIIISGNAKGPDQYGIKYAEENNIRYKLFPAHWGLFGKPAGIIRNRLMAAYSDQLIAFWDGKSRGTKHMINIAKRVGLETKIIIWERR